MGKEALSAERILARVGARNKAKLIVLLLLEEEAKIPGEAKESFWDEISKVIPIIKRKPRPTLNNIEPMTYNEAKEFGKEIMPFGEFRGVRVDDVPLNRLMWYADQRFQLKLRRYLASKRIQAEVQNEPE